MAMLNNQRVGELELLTHHFWRTFGGDFSDGAWAGNFMETLRSAEMFPAKRTVFSDKQIRNIGAQYGPSCGTPESCGQKPLDEWPHTEKSQKTTCFFLKDFTSRKT